MGTLSASYNSEVWTVWTAVSLDSLESRLCAFARLRLYLRCVCVGGRGPSSWRRRRVPAPATSASSSACCRPGRCNAITDVAGVRVGQTTLIRGESVRTGVTAILPHEGNLFQEKVPAADLRRQWLRQADGIDAGSRARRDRDADPADEHAQRAARRRRAARLDARASRQRGACARSTRSSPRPTTGILNDIRGRHVGRDEVFAALDAAAKGGPVEEGAVGAGTGTVAFGFKGGIGIVLAGRSAALGGYTVGVLVQSNFGGVLTIDGAPVGEELGRYYLKEQSLTPRDSEGRRRRVAPTARSSSSSRPTRRSTRGTSNGWLLARWRASRAPGRPGRTAAATT